MASRRLHRTSHLNDSAATARACSSADRQCSVTTSRACSAVAGSLIEPGPEVGEAVPVDPGVEALERGEPLGHQVRREQLGQRRRHRLHPGPGAGERSRRRRRRTAPRGRGDVRRAPPRGSARPPRPGAAMPRCRPPRRGAVVVDDPADPAPAHLDGRGSWRGSRRPCGGCSPGSRSGWPPSPGSGGGSAGRRSSGRGTGAGRGSAATGRATPRRSSSVSVAVDRHGSTPRTSRPSMATSMPRPRRCAAPARRPAGSGWCC